MAKRYRFRLEVVLRLRRQKQDDCRRTVAARLRQIAGLGARIDRLNEALGTESARLRTLALPDGTERAGGAGALDIPGIRRHRNYALYLQDDTAAARRELAEQRGELKREQAALAQAAKNVKALEKLEERQRRGHDLILRRAELAQADEIGAQFARRQRWTGDLAGQVSQLS